MFFQPVELKRRCLQHVPSYGFGFEVFCPSASYSRSGCALHSPEGIMHILIYVMCAPDIVQCTFWDRDLVTWNDTCEELLYINDEQEVVL